MDVHNKLIQILCETLGVDEDMIKSESSIIEDLGAESIDLVDICYQLEKCFKFGKIKVDDIYPIELEDIYDTYSEEAFNILIKGCPHLIAMKNDFVQKNSFELIKSVKALEEFVKWKIGNGSK